MHLKDKFIEAVFSDLDDTLIVNKPLFDDAKAKLVGFLSAYRIDADMVRATHEAIDRELFAIHGVSPERPPLAYEKTLRALVSNVSNTDIKTIRGFAENIFTTPAADMYGTEESIDMVLESGRRFVIVTAGGDKEQAARIEDKPWKDKVELIVVKKKTSAVFAEIAKKLGLRPDSVVMIGDSITSDMQPACLAGLHGVHVPLKPGVSGNYHPLQDPSALLPESAYRYGSAIEAVKHIVEYDTPAPASSTRYLFSRKI